MTDDWSIFDPPNPDELARHAEDLTHRANLVRTHGWDDYRHRWSCGEVLGTTLVLDDDSGVQRCCETTDSPLERWAYDLRGITGGQSDVDAGLQRTRAWFDSIRAAR